MSDCKKYYYLKIKEDFFESEDIKILQNLDEGYLFSDILMKLYLKSLKNNGKLMFKDHIPYNPKMIATVTNHSVSVVEKALFTFKSMGLIEVLDNGAIFMLDIENFIGQSSSEGDRKRQYRRRIDEEKQKILSSGQKSDIYPPKTETETELKTEIEQELEQQLEDIDKVLKNSFENDDKATIKKYCIENNVAVNVVVEKLEIINNMKKIRNKVGALLTAIKEDWKQPEKDCATVSKFNNFQGREYDYDLLEKKLLGWDNDEEVEGKDESNS